MTSGVANDIAPALAALDAIRSRTNAEDVPLHVAADIEQIIFEVGGYAPEPLEH